jgi:antitoxin FitA
MSHAELEGSSEVRQRRGRTRRWRSGHRGRRGVGDKLSGKPAAVPARRGSTGHTAIRGVHLPDPAPVSPPDRSNGPPRERTGGAAQGHLLALLSTGVVAMAAVSIRDLDDQVRERLRVRAAQHGRSMEAEIRAILTAAVSEPTSTAGFAPTLLARFGALGGVDLELPPRTATPRAAHFGP